MVLWYCGILTSRPNSTAEQGGGCHLVRPWKIVLAVTLSCIFAFAVPHNAGGILIPVCVF